MCPLGRFISVLDVSYRKIGLGPLKFFFGYRIKGLDLGPLLYQSFDNVKGRRLSYITSIGLKGQAKNTNDSIFKRSRNT